jgi:hypothetical protein
MEAYEDAAVSTVVLFAVGDEETPTMAVGAGGVRVEVAEVELDVAAGEGVRS